MSDTHKIEITSIETYMKNGFHRYVVKYMKNGVEWTYSLLSSYPITRESIMADIQKKASGNVNGNFNDII